MTHLLNGTIIPLAGAYAFGLIGCKIAEERELEHVEIIALILCATLSHGGGFTRDLLSILVTHRFILPSAFSSCDSWMAAVFAFATYLTMKISGNYKFFERRDVTLALTVTDSLAVANYTFIGASRMVNVFDYSCLPAIALFAGCTALGGGLWTLLVYRPDKLERFKGNLVYYLSTLLSACVASRLTMIRHHDIGAGSLILSLFCAWVALSSDYLTNRPRHSWRMYRRRRSINSHHEPTINLPLSFGALFELVQNPARGIHLHLTAPLHFGKGSTRCVMIETLA